MRGHGMSKLTVTNLLRWILIMPVLLIRVVAIVCLICALVVVPPIDRSKEQNEVE